MLAAFASVIVFGACPSSAKPRVNVLFIVIDTLRADRLGCYGNPRGLTPNIDRLAASGVRFSDCSSHAPWTLPSFAALFTSLYPPEHGAGGHLGEFKALPDSARTIAEAFHEAGYATAAITNVDFLGPSFGLLQGFDHKDCKYFETNDRVRRADATTDAALEWLAQNGDQPHFLFVHYFDAHAAYDPQPEWRAKFAEPEDRKSTWTFGSREQLIAHRLGKLALDPTTMRRAAALYDAEVAAIDAAIGRLLDAQKSTKGRAETLVVLTADHGEEFLDHGSWEHGHSVYQELLHVPLIVAEPGRIPVAKIDVPVRHIDVAPTLCELADLGLEKSFRGTSLVGTWSRSAAGPGLSFAEGSFLGAPKTCWRHANWTLLLSDDGITELYDLDKDPTQQANLAPVEPERAAAMTSELALARKAFAARQGKQVELSQEELDRLRKIGYAFDSNR